LEISSCNLAISLHSPFEDERKKLMPIEKAQPFKEIIKEIKSHDISRYRKISIEYILFKGVNDSAKHVNELAKVLSGVRCRVNLIHFHPIPGTALQGVPLADMELFRDELNKKGILATIRKSRGQDISAACGLLSTNRSAS